MNTKSLISVVAFALAFLTGCQKDVKITTSSGYDGDLFVECILVPGRPPQAFLSNSAAFFAPNVTPQDLFARDAEVYLTGPLGVDTLVPDSTFDEFRCRWVPYYSGSAQPVIGQSYQLDIVWNGRAVTAKTAISQPKVEIDSLKYIGEFFDSYGGHDGLALWITDPLGPGNFYRFQMNRMIDSSRHHVHALDTWVPDCSNGNKFFVPDLGRIIFSDKYIDGQQMELLVEVSFEYKKGDSAWVFIQSLDQKSAEFYQEMDRQLQSIMNPFVEPEFIETKIQGAIGVFGSAVVSDSVLFIYPQDNPQ